MLKYRVNTIYRTIQGEGYWSGMPCTLVRLQDCNLRCPFCDTKETWDPSAGEEISLTDLFQKITDLHLRGDIVLITGGEPTLQPLTPLVNMLGMLGPVHLETNGTTAIDDAAFFSWITVSPKPNRILDPSILGRMDELKWLIAGKEDVQALLDFLPHLPKTADHKKICVQPVSQDPSATKIAFEACLKYGWRLSIQQHKLVGVK